MVDSVSSSLPDFVPEILITKTLLLNNGDVDAAVSHLLESSSQSTASSVSTPHSSFSAQSGNYSIPRESESDDEEDVRGPNRRKVKKEPVDEEQVKVEQIKEKWGIPKKTMITTKEIKVEEKIEQELASIPPWQMAKLSIETYFA